MQRDDIPELNPMWADDKGDARHKVYKFLNDQNLRVIKEIEPQTYDNMVTELARISTTLVKEINEHNPLVKEIISKHVKEGIMRRNGLLLEHIMHDRLNNNQAAVSYFKTPDDIEGLNQVYNGKAYWPKETPLESVYDLPVYNKTNYTVMCHSDLDNLQKQVYYATHLPRQY